ncbi:MAG: porin [Cypionkella sp.]
MKKILLATTVLAASAGFAAAEVTVSGNARMGVQALQSSDPLAANADALFYQRLRIIFTATGETDGGLSFGGSVRNDQSGVGKTANGDSTVFISGAFGKITMGDVSGAPDALVGQVSAVGFTSLGSYNEIGFLSNDKTAALYTYSAGALTFGVGIGQTGPTATVPQVTGQAYSVAVKYATDMYSIALGYENTDLTGNQTSLLGSATFSGATVKAKIVDQTVGNGDLAYALSVDYTMNGIGLTGFYAANRDFADTDAYGIGASYDLGGGAVVRGGIVKVKDDGHPVSFDLGLNMSF